MCGIVGILGRQPVAPLLVEALKRLEYRGYDSAGITNTNGSVLETHRAAGADGRFEEINLCLVPPGRRKGHVEDLRRCFGVAAPPGAYQQPVHRSRSRRSPSLGLGIRSPAECGPGQRETGAEGAGLVCG